MSRTTITRAELHAMVWEKPLRTAAKELGVSDVGLSKICKRHGVPTPPQGHWTLVQLGKPVSTIPLPKAEEGQSEKIEIIPWVSRLPAGAVDGIAKLETELEARLDGESAARSKDPFPPVEQPHRALRSTASKLRRAKAERDGSVHATDDGMCGIETRPEDVERLIAFLDALAAQLDSRGIKFTPLGRSMKIERGPDDATFSIKPRKVREAFEPTEAERAVEQKRLARAELERKRQGYVSWSNNQPTYPEFHQVPTGQYTLSIDGWSSGLRKNWSDGKTQTLESLFDDIVVGLDAYLIAQKARREEHEAWKRAYQESERQRALAQRRREREQERLKFIQRLFDYQTEASQLRAWLAQAETQNAAGQPQYERFVSWARQRLALVQEQSAPAVIEEALAKTRLFPDVDELADPVPNGDQD